MNVTTYNDAVVIPHAPDWRSPPEWSRSWDTRIESAVTGSEARVGLRLKPREKIRFRLVPLDLAERLAMVARLKAASKAGLALAPHWGRGATLTVTATGASLAVVTDTFKAQPGDLVFVQSGDIESWEAFEVAEVTVHRNRTLSLTAPLSRTYPAGARVFPTITGRITIGELEALEDWRQAVTVEVQQLRTVPSVLLDPSPDEAGQDYWFDGAPVPKFGWGGTFDHWLEGAPILDP